MTGSRSARTAGARPLTGRSVVVTRPAAQSTSLIDRLGGLGAEVILAPTIATVDPDDGGVALRAATARLASYDWVVVTSPNGAERLIDAIRAVDPIDPIDGSCPVSVPARVAAVGPGTGAVLAAAGVPVDLLPDRFVAESLLDAFPDAPAGGGRVLLARAAVARDVLPDGFRERGWTVDVVDAYRTVAVGFDDATRERVRAADVVAFTSSSSVTGFVAAMGGAGAVSNTTLPSVVTIGPVTSTTARDLGLLVAAEADPHSIDGLTNAVVAAVVDAST